MKKLVIALYFLASINSCFAGEEPEVIYWDSEAGKILRSHIPADADYWQLSMTFAVQSTQTYCSVASAITVLNAMPIKKPVDPAYAPYAYFTQSNFFTSEVIKVISPQTVLAIGMTMEQMAETLIRHGLEAETIAGDALSDEQLRTLLRKTLGDDGHFVLANYLRSIFGQMGGGHWSVLAAFDEQSDRVLILDVAKYKYAPVWVGISTLRQAVATLDATSNKARGLVIASMR